jgi:uncharacterized membrane protein
LFPIIETFGEKGSNNRHKKCLLLDISGKARGGGLFLIGGFLIFKIANAKAKRLQNPDRCR